MATGVESFLSELEYKQWTISEAPSIQTIEGKDYAHYWVQYPIVFPNAILGIGSASNSWSTKIRPYVNIHNLALSNIELLFAYEIEFSGLQTRTSLVLIGY